VPQPGQRQRLVEAEPEHHTLARPDVAVELFELARGPPARRERREIAPELRRRAPAPLLDCGDRADPEPEVVVAEPVAEVVP